MAASGPAPQRPDGCYIYLCTMAKPQVFIDGQAGTTGLRIREWLADRGIVALEDVDTRSLTLHLRSVGALRGAVVSGEVDRERAKGRCARSAPQVGGHRTAI